MTITTVENDIKERLSIAYATAVAARAGCELTEVRVDRNGIDGTIRAIRGTRVKIDVQLKATSSPTFDGNEVVYDLDVAGYNALRSTQIQAPQLLVILALSEKEAHWLLADEHFSRSVPIGRIFTASRRCQTRLRLECVYLEHRCSIQMCCATS